MKKNIYFLFLLFFTFIFFIYFSYLSLKRVNSLNSHYYDLGIMNQVVYNTSKGRFLQMTNPTFLKDMSRFAIHFDPILAIFAPLYLIKPSFAWLLLGQVFVISIGAIFLFFLANKVLKNQLLSLFISTLFMLNFAVQWMILFDFHAVVLATTFFIAAFYFLEERKWGWYYFFVILSLLTKEHIGLIVIFLGFYILLFKKEKKHSLITIFLGLVFFVLTNFYIIPYFRGDKHFASNYFVNIKNRFLTIIHNGSLYFLRLTIPLFFVFLAPEIFLIATPEWAINILSLNNNMRAIYFHYHALIVAFLFIALPYGIRKFLDLIKNKRIRILFFVLFILSNIYSIYNYSPLLFFGKQKFNYQDIHWLTKKSIAYWQEKLKDENIAVATTPKLAPFFTYRKTYFNFLFDPAFGEIGEVESDIINRSDKYKMADYVIIYKKEIGDISQGSLPVKIYQKLQQDKNFQMIYSDSLNDRYGGAIEVYKVIKSIKF